MSAGSYPIRFQHRAHSYGTPGDVGDPTDQYAAVAYLWGGYDTDRSGLRTPNLGSDQAGATCTLRIRNTPTVAPLDTITDPKTGEVWEVESVERGSNELIVRVTGGASSLRA